MKTCKIRIITTALFVAMLFAGCSNTATNTPTASPTSQPVTVAPTQSSSGSSSKSSDSSSSSSSSGSSSKSKSSSSSKSKCITCHGTGYVKYYTGKYDAGEIGTCPSCNGTGYSKWLLAGYSCFLGEDAKPKKSQCTTIAETVYDLSGRSVQGLRNYCLIEYSSLIAAGISARAAP